MAKAVKQPPPKAAGTDRQSLRHRSPNYPSIDLRAAVDKLPGLFEAMKRHPVGVEVAVKAMGYSYSSSTGKLALAAFRAFGLLDNVQTGSNATVKLSIAALDIAADYPRESASWWAAVKKSALAPNIHSQLWEKYGSNLPADDEVRRYLVRELKFSDKAVGAFIEEYKATIDFAKLTDSDIIGEDDGDQTAPDLVFANPFAGFKPKTQSETKMRELPITLPSLNIAVLKVPTPMTEIDFTTLVSSLNAWKDALVQKPKPASKDDDPDPEDDE